LALVIIRVGSATNLSRKSGVSERSIHNYLAGSREPKGSVFARLAEAAGVRVEWLLTGAEPMLPDAPKAEEPGARYGMSVQEARSLIASLGQELRFDPGGDWTGLLIELMTDHGLKPSGARKVLEHLAAFRAARDAA
jgi:transcriptional regulator with XRE-family HTH domain